MGSATDSGGLLTLVRHAGILLIRRSGLLACAWNSFVSERFLSIKVDNNIRLVPCEQSHTSQRVA